MKNDETETLRNEILGIINNENVADDLIIYQYLSSINYITYLCSILRANLSNYGTGSTTLDRELGLAMEQNGSSVLLDHRMMIQIIKNVFQITEINGSDFGIDFSDKPALN